MWITIKLQSLDVKVSKYIAYRDSVLKMTEKFWEGLVNGSLVVITKVEDKRLRSSDVGNETTKLIH
jgi:hypothetical protein